MATLLVGAAPANPSRHAVAGSYHVPQPWVWTPIVSTTNAVSNGSFETGAVDRGWFQCGDVDAYIIKAHAYHGTYAAYSGTRNGTGEPNGNSGICQHIKIPPNGLLSARLYQLSNESDATFAYQEAALLDDSGDVIVNLYRSVNDRPSWVLGTWNLAAYAGRSVWLYFGVHGDGYPNRATQQFLDDVVLAGRSSSGAKNAAWHRTTLIVSMKSLTDTKNGASRPCSFGSALVSASPQSVQRLRTSECAWPLRNEATIQRRSASKS